MSVITAAELELCVLRAEDPTARAEFLLPGWLSAFRHLSPEVHPQLEVINSPRAITAVPEGHSAIGFVEGRDSLTALERMTVAGDELVVVVGSAHPWARRRTRTIADLANDAYLTREAASGTRAVATAALAAAGIELDLQCKPRAPKA